VLPSILRLAPTEKSFLVERLYEEYSGNRAFSVCIEESIPLDAFTKKTGLDFEITLLNVYANPDGRPFPVLWEIRCAWLDQKVDEATVLDLISRSAK
jgi:hypothetical protein